MCSISSRALRDIDTSPSDFDVFRNRFAPNRQSTMELALLAGAGVCLCLMLALGDGPGGPAAVANGSVSRQLADLEERWRIARGKYDWNFQSGMDAWVNPKEPLSPSTRWKSGGGAVRPAELRMWRDTQQLTNYRLEFSGRIESKGMSWAYRVADARNYYAAKLVLSGPVVASRSDLLRYAVINGRESNRVRVAVPVSVRAEKTYSIRTDVKGNEFTTFLDGKLIDHWSDGRLAHGGVGFFAEKGEIADIYQVQIAAENDVVRRLLAHMGFFAPLTR